ncbi:MULTISPECIES: hypothetical protein [unclassified Synechococcus]|uniref:hypothetical protein n=1 Tax=unclassified Synechococcus TaxID=2626047 RepID=UPI002000DC80|nr:hypothetical protein [Synechococcus sp. A10-1-5-1]UPM50206.1 hypothetical protein MY494_13020 [Synechococcus sp. A10-1-5-1]
MASFSLRSLVALSALASITSPVCAQDVQQTFDKIDRLQKEGPSLQRAMNLARTKAVSLNGGLRHYVPAACMFSTTLARQSCLIQSDSLGFVFRFSGGSPGWQAEGRSPSVTTEVSVSADGKALLNIQNLMN